MTIDERLDRLMDIVEAHDGQIEAHNEQIDGLIKLAGDLVKMSERHQSEIEQLVREWQAYLRRIPPQ